MTSGSSSVDAFRRQAFAGLVVAVVFGLALGMVAANELLKSPANHGLGVLLLALAGVAVVFGVCSYAQAALLGKLVSTTVRSYDATLELLETARRTSEHTHAAAENSGLSDAAKRVIYREKDYEYLRDTILAAIARQDWEGAEHLIHDLGHEFGYLEEASRLRDQLESARRLTTEESVAAAIARVDQLCDEERWTQAVRESQRMLGQFRGEPRILQLSARIDVRRREFKKRLLGEYDVALRTHDLDTAHRLLVHLDQYLEASEADSLKESARTVFRARLEQMRAQFSVAVSCKQFAGAVELAEKLIREFPNSGYAQELSRLMPVLRERAARESRTNVAIVPA